MRPARLLVTGIGALILAGCPGPTAPRQIGIGGGGGGNRVLVFLVPPPDTARAGVAFEVQVAAFDTVLQAVDTTASGGVTVSLGSNPGGATLTSASAPTLTIPFASGVSTFTDLVIDAAGSGYTLKAASAGLATITSQSFIVTP